MATACAPTPFMIVDSTLLQTVLPVAIVVTGWIITHQLSLRAQRRSFQSQVLDRARLDVTSKQSKETRAWSVALEDYQILFPETALARFRLDRRHIRILKAIGPIHSDLLRLSRRARISWQVNEELGGGLSVKV